MLGVIRLLVVIRIHISAAYTGCSKYSSPLNFFVVFSATVLNFNLKFYSFIY